MGTATISFKTEPPRSGTGMLLLESSGLPNPPACAKSKMIERLEGALADLARTPCSFWACEGPEHPKSMVTCTKCWAMRDIAAVKKRLEKMNL